MQSISMCRRKITLRHITVIIGLIAFFRPTIFEKFATTNTFFNNLLIGAFILTFFDFIRLRNKISDSFLLNTFLFYFVMIFSTILNIGSVSRMISIVLVGLCTTIFAWYSIKYEFKLTVFVMRTLMWLYVIINILTIILYPNGIVSTGSSQAAVYFLGQPTRFAYFYFPGLLFCWLGDEYSFGHIKQNTIILYFVCLISLIAKWSMGSTIAMLILVPFFFFNKLEKIFHIKIYFLVQIFAYFGLTFFSVQYYFLNFINNILKKDVTLSSRTLIWSIAIRNISLSPFWGVGTFSNEEMLSLFHFVHVHNHLLQITLQCGYFGLIVFVLLIFQSYRRLNYFKSFMPAKIVSVFLFVVGIQLLVDTVDGVRNHYLFLLAIGAYISEIYKLFKQNSMGGTEIESRHSNSP